MTFSSKLKRGLCAVTTATLILLGSSLSAQASAGLNAATPDPTVDPYIGTGIPIPTPTATYAPGVTPTPTPTPTYAPGITPTPGTSTAGSTFASGDGSKSNPFVIRTSTDLHSVRNFMDKHFVLGNDIDMNNAVFEPIGTYANSSTVDAGTPFTGAFNGQGYTIKNIKIGDSEKSNQGLFAYASGARIWNLRIENVKLQSKELGGVLVAYAKNCQIEKITVGSEHQTAQISGGDSLGGMIGRMDGTTSLKFSKAYVDITGGKNVGGLVAQVEKSTNIRDGASVGTVEGTEAVGGLAAHVYGRILDSHADTDVILKGSGKDAGGLVAVLYNRGSIDKSSASGDVTGIINVGGLVARSTVFYAVGEETPAKMPSPSIKSSTAAGEVKGVLNVGGFFGLIEEKTTVRGCTAKGDVFVVEDLKLEKEFATSNDDADQPEEQDSTTSSSASSINSGSVGGGFVGKVDGSTTIQSATAEGDVDGVESIGGFVGELSDGSSIRNSKATGDVSGKVSVGGFAGFVYGNINGCTVTGDVAQTGRDHDAGGIAGTLANQGIIKNSSVSGKVEGNENVGGIVGRILTYYPEGTTPPTRAVVAKVDNCQYNGSIMGNINVGGMVGNATENADIKKSMVTATIDATDDLSTSGEVVGVKGKNVTVSNSRTANVTMKKA